MRLNQLLAGFGDQLTFDTVPVSSTGSGSVERFELRATDLSSFAMQHFGPALLNGGSVRSRVEILNGVGTAGLAQLVADAIVPAGGAVVLTGNSVQVTGAGPVTLQANQPGDVFFLPAVPINQTFNVIVAAILKYRGQSRTLLHDETTREAPPYVLEKP